MALIRIICMLGIILNFSSCRSVEQGMRESFLPAPGDNPSAVSLDIGDEIAIAVWRNAEFDQTVKIDENGNIYLPLVGEMRIVGKTTTQIRRQIEEQLIHMPR